MVAGIIGQMAHFSQELNREAKCRSLGPPEKP